MLNVTRTPLEELQKYLDALPHSFYTYLCHAEGEVKIINLDLDDSIVKPVYGPVAVIQSGGKMWCGYPEFIEHVRHLATVVDDALFFVGDEDDYIDEFRIVAGCLHYSRVHEGCWWPVDDYLQSEGL